MESVDELDETPEEESLQGYDMDTVAFVDFRIAFFG